MSCLCHVYEFITSDSIVSVAAIKKRHSLKIYLIRQFHVRWRLIGWCARCRWLLKWKRESGQLKTKQSLWLRNVHHSLNTQNWPLEVTQFTNSLNIYLIKQYQIFRWSMISWFDRCCRWLLKWKREK